MEHYATELRILNRQFDYILEHALDEDIAHLRSILRDANLGKERERHVQARLNAMLRRRSVFDTE